MNILFINPNRYHYPPVIPLALEYLAGELTKTQHTFSVLDLCFSDNPEKDLLNEVKQNKPDIVGFTIRQIDTVLYHNNEFFLDEIKKLIQLCKKQNLKVILGGVGFSIMPGKILEYTGADFGINGPGEIALVQLLNDLEKNEKPKKIIYGYKYFNLKYYSFKREKVVNYEHYIKKDGIIGFRTQVGCNSSCPFCTEANKKIIFHYPDEVGKEVAGLKKQGYSHFHLCDSEFNLDTGHCISVCKSIVKYAGPINWALYMKPEPFSEELFYWIKQSGANLITLSLNTYDYNKEYLEKLKLFFQYAKINNIKIAIDLSTGFPYEDIENLKTIIDFLNNQPIETVGVNAFYRIYPNTLLYKQIIKNKTLKQYLINWTEGADFIHPVFFNYFSENQLNEIIEKKTKFRLEGFEKATNYQRVKK